MAGSALGVSTLFFAPQAIRSLLDSITLSLTHIKKIYHFEITLLQLPITNYCATFHLPNISNTYSFGHTLFRMYTLMT